MTRAKAIAALRDDLLRYLVAASLGGCLVLAGVLVGAAWTRPAPAPPPDAQPLTITLEDGAALHAQPSTITLANEAALTCEARYLVGDVPVRLTVSP